MEIYYNVHVVIGWAIIGGVAFPRFIGSSKSFGTSDAYPFLSCKIVPFKGGLVANRAWNDGANLRREFSGGR